MEKLYYNLSEEEFSKSRKVLLWVFGSLFFLGGIYVLTAGPVFGHRSIPPVISAAPLGISLLVFLIATLATIKREDLFFLIDDEKIEFRYGLFRPHRQSFRWEDINGMIMPNKERKAKLLLKDGKSYVIDLTYLQKKKSSIIRKHIYQYARLKEINITKVNNLR